MKPKTFICLGLLLIALVFKFWLVDRMEITDDRFDPFNYMVQILFNAGNDFAPGTGYFGKLLFALGIPFRIGIECSYLVSCLLVVKALFDWPMKSPFSLGLYLVLIFNPAPEEFFSHLLSDQVWLVEVMAGLALFIFFVNRPSPIGWFYLMLSMVCLGFAVITRTTLIPLEAGFLLWLVLSTALSMAKGGMRGLDFRMITGCLACVLAVGLFHYSICCLNSKYRGYFGLSVPDSNEYRDFYMCLQSVGGPTGEKYYPIDDDRMSLIATAGPKSQWLVEQMRKNTFFRKTSQDAYGKYDLALAWFHFVVFESAGAEDDPKKAFALFRDIENEIAQAARENRLKVRPIIPLPDCRIPIVLSAMPDALRHVAALTTEVPSRYAWDSENGEPKFESKYFTMALTRRNVERSLFREKIGQELCVVYSYLYAPLFLCLQMVAGLFVGCLIYRWRKIPALSACFWVRQLFAALLISLFFWFALFDASGVPAVSRYLLLHNVLLPLLVVYYGRLAWYLVRGDYSLL